MFNPRPKQAEVLKYTSGLMGVSAVPGSGKTRTLSALASQIIASKALDDDQEVLIVTLVNSAVDNFSRQIADFVKDRGLLPGFGYRVRTLHGLANDIVREKPGLVGLEDGFQIVDEREADDILQDAALTWTRTNPAFGEDYLDYEMDENKRGYILRDKWPTEVTDISRAFIKQAKDWQMSPADVRAMLDRFGKPLPLAEMSYAIYVAYQRGLNYRGAVDFQDLIRLAYRILQDDAQFLERKRHQWAYILEDEAQDSSELQEEILGLLAGKRGNWVRVGDPNQSIYETFTTASPEHLRVFMAKGNVKARELPNSGRSSQSIIALANFLIDWSMSKHPIEALHDRALKPPLIEPTPEGDPQPNPTDQPEKIHIRPEDYTPAQEIEALARSIEHWLPENQDKTVAVLVPRNNRGAQMVTALKQRNIDVVELLRSTSSTRETAGALALILDSLSNPNATPALAKAFRVFKRADRDDPDLTTRLDRIVTALRKCHNLEEYIQPRPDKDWLESEIVTDLTNDDESIMTDLIDFRALMRRWQSAAVLPIDQLVLTLTQDLFDTAADLAIAHSLALYLGKQAQTSPHWRLPEFTAELKLVAQNKRRVVDLSEEGNGYNPEDHKGKVTIATMHASKGLEWDRVYLMSVNNYDFPSAEPQDSYIGERWYIRDDLNLQAEALEQLRLSRDPIAFDYIEGSATEDSRVEYAAERLRLLYVGITRARSELVMTWNTGRNGNVLQATPFIALRNFWEDYKTTPKKKKRSRRKKKK